MDAGHQSPWHDKPDSTEEDRADPAVEPTSRPIRELHSLGGESGECLRGCSDPHRRARVHWLADVLRDVLAGPRQRNRPPMARSITAPTRRSPLNEPGLIIFLGKLIMIRARRNHCGSTTRRSRGPASLRDLADQPPRLLSPLPDPERPSRRDKIDVDEAP